jgi:AraC family transcriptional regulator, transcriptional activator of pobA
MRRFRSLLIDRADIRLPGLAVMTFAVHRHLAARTAVELHRHDYCQVLLYLHGRGRQVFAEGAVEVEPASLVVLPPGVWHAFQRLERRVPLCLMIDFRIKDGRRRPVAVCRLNRSQFLEVRQHLVRLLRLRAGPGELLRWEGASTVLQVLIALLQACGWLERASGPAPDRGGPVVRTLLSGMDPRDSLAQTVGRSGFNRDHLNRLVKRETGLTLGQYRARQRLANAKDLLAQGQKVSQVAETVGLPDQGYFARWFRRQTGQSPLQWMRSSRSATV